MTTPRPRLLPGLIFLAACVRTNAALIDPSVHGDLRPLRFGEHCEDLRER